MSAMCAGWRKPAAKTCVVGGNPHLSKVSHGSDAPTQMADPLVVYQRNLPNQRVAFITLEDHGEQGCWGRLRVERRADPDRQRDGYAPLIAEVRGSERREVLMLLQRIAEDEREVTARLAQWSVDRAPLPVDVVARDGEL